MVDSLGILRIEAIHYYVRDLERSRKFYLEKLDFAETGVSSPELEKSGQQKSAVFQAGSVRVICSQPLGEQSRAARWLKKHPDGVGTVIFQVADVERAFQLLDKRGGTPITDVQWDSAAGGRFGTFNITTPFGGSTFRFVERDNFTLPFPGMQMHPQPRGGKNAFGFAEIDHITSNFETIKPATLWLEHVMGFEEYWGIEFHTDDVAEGKDKGSGLRSKVFADPDSGVKFANNEPMRPFFKASQINIFYEEQRGDGIQHAALTVNDIIPAVKGLRARNVQFFPTPGAYYDMLPERMKKLGIGRVDEDLTELRNLQILVDGSDTTKYLLQIFLQDSAHTYGDPNAGPFFFEIIQRKGDKGFGGGNFRALFESIERQQQGAQDGPGKQKGKGL